MPIIAWRPWTVHVETIRGSHKNHIYMSNFNFHSLTPGHVAVLKELGYWDHILANRAHVTADGPKALGGMPAMYEY